MPRNKFVNHKGRNRRFTNPEELEEQRLHDQEEGPSKETKTSSSSSGSDAESSSEEEEGKPKGVSNLIEIQNPNRVQKKEKKLSTLNETLDLAEPDLSRREREEIKKQKARAFYQKMHAEGKTEQARADLARLAIIKQQREEAQRRRELEKKEKEEAAKMKTAQTQKALGKKS